MQEKILLEVVNKFKKLRLIHDWNNELLSKAPPVLWFGDSKSNKDKIVTIGANPSRWEFLDQSLMKDCNKPYNNKCYESKYLSKQRFYHFKDNQTYDDIAKSKILRNDIIASYDSYYKSNPYHWFGKNKNNSYNVEGVLRGLEASYFDINSKYRACHIDIFPFATISDFNKIKTISERDILANSWGKNIVDALLNYLDPIKVLVFGRTNFDYFCKYFGINKGVNSSWSATVGKGKCDYWYVTYKHNKVFGVSVNLGNPKGFDSKGLRELGEYLNIIKSP